MKLPIIYFTLTAVVLMALTSSAKAKSENGEAASKESNKAKLDFKRRFQGNRKRSFLEKHGSQPASDFQWNQRNKKFKSLDSAPLQYGCTCSCPSSSPLPSYNYNYNQSQNQQQQQVAGQQNFTQLSQTQTQTIPQGASPNFVGPAPLVQPFIPLSNPSQGQSQDQSAHSAWQSSARPPFPSRSTDVPATRSTLNPGLPTSVSASESPSTQQVTSSTIQPTTHAQSQETSSNGNLPDISSLAEETTSTQYSYTDYEAESSTGDIPHSPVPLSTSNAKVENGSVPISDSTSEPIEASSMTTVVTNYVIAADTSAADDSTNSTITTTTEEPATSTVLTDAEAVREIENNYYGNSFNNYDDYDTDLYVPHLPVFVLDYDEA